ncbi:1-acyl-sn-glycerol-3-phosphate acyltransferase [Cyanobium sp. CH-040]|uniref:lysophospholipid acyltransferase family protein n=1 Tax=Cyanobium sp. CH-040 TaxID=2823708 RepID=UPI0020CDEFCB|nr:1-acyl-sn-glycerol-3-phosphate acyltransferase [Cyanobium sp. CH-040]MCP9927658.1 1-acyl-sn-glycerol-3-phosphate acyltransferase [Cyanobium sp. CH-040]
MTSSRISPWLAPLARLVTQDITLPLWFRAISVEGIERVPRRGPVLLAPTHRARWDGLLLPHAAGRRATGRDCRFMVTIDEMEGLQGWFLRRLGCFPVNQLRPSLGSLRHAVELLEAGEQLVVFPEGRIRRHADEPMLLQPGLARIAALAGSRGVPVQVVPVGIAYGHPWPRPCGRAAVCFGEPMRIDTAGREAAALFTEQLALALLQQERRAELRVRPAPAPAALVAREAGEQSP